MKEKNNLIIQDVSGSKSYYFSLVTSYRHPFTVFFCHSIYSVVSKDGIKMIIFLELDPLFRTWSGDETFLNQ